MVETTLSSHLHLLKCSLSMEQSLNLCLRWFAQGCISSCSSTALNNASSEISSNHFSLKKKAQGQNAPRNRWRTKKRRQRRQKGGILPLAALLPALIPGGKAIGLAAAGAGASYGVNKALESATRKRWFYRWKTLFHLLFWKTTFFIIFSHDVICKSL